MKPFFSFHIRQRTVDMRSKLNEGRGEKKCSMVFWVLLEQVTGIIFPNSSYYDPSKFLSKITYKISFHGNEK
ncbi:hypothetical protein BT93_J1506 [Corymbia citriodora subsp. variegata]|nr:hypothetical protein BT93_J1506 [Corymbia citriodora subsp. variegata]